MNRFPRFRLVLAATVSLCLVGAAQAGGARTPVVGTPMLQGRAVARFMLEGYARFGSGLPGGPTYMFLPGIFVPVGQDAEGYYFQAAQGLRSSFSESSQVAGGVYVPRSAKYQMSPYIGDARDQSALISVVTRGLPYEEMQKFKVAVPPAGAKPKK